MKKSFITAVLFFLVSSIGVVCKGSNLPEVGVSLSHQNYALELDNVFAADSKVGELVLPPLEFRPGEPLDFKDYTNIIDVISRMPVQPGRVWLRLKLLQPPGGKENEAIEKDVREIVSQLSSRINLKYTGLILEAEDPCSNELVQLVIASFSVSLKSSEDTVEIAFLVKGAARLGTKMPAYIDRLIVNGRGNWRPVLEQLSEMPVKRPVSLLVREETGYDAPGCYLDSFFNVPGLRPDRFIIENPGPKGIEELVAMVEGLKKYLPTGMIRFDETSSFYRLVDEGGARPPQTVFTDESLNNVVILARPGGMGKQKLWFSSPESDHFKFNYYDPLNINAAERKAVSSPEIAWDKKYILLLAKKSGKVNDRISDSISVSGSVGLSLEEIVARRQRYDTRQKQLIKNYTAKFRMDMHFEPPGLGTGFDVSLHFKYFWNVDGTRHWEQMAQYLNGLKLRTKRSFPLPMLEPDQVMTQPLELNLVESYVYRLEEETTIKEKECYVVSFRPRPGIEKTLYSGKMWIDKSDFRTVRISLVQNDSSGSITSNKEMQYFELLEGPAGNMFNLLVKSEVEQKVMAAGREFLLERHYRFEDIRVNDPQFDPRLEESKKGDLPMFTETKDGLRELVIEKDGSRKVEEKVDTFIWSLVTGVLYDDTANFPIPFIGASAMDYDFLDTGAQMSALLVVPFLAVNLTKQFKGNFTVGTDLALSIVPRNDRVYRDSVEIEAERMYVFSGGFGLRLGWQPTPEISLKLSNYLFYEYFVAGDETVEDFVLPRNGFTYNPRLDLEYSLNGFRLNLAASYFNRLGWKTWGLVGNDEGLYKTYMKFSGLFGKRFYIGSFIRFGADVSYFTGTNLDRFSRFQPSMFTEPQVRGIPSGGISLDTIAVLSLNAGFTVFDFVRFDAYYSFARGIEESKKIDFQGVELDFATIGPRTSYIQGRITYAAAGPLERYRSRWGVYLMVFIPFK